MSKNKPFCFSVGYFGHSHAKVTNTPVHPNWYPGNWARKIWPVARAHSSLSPASWFSLSNSPIGTISLCTTKTVISALKISERMTYFFVWIRKDYILNQRAVMEGKASPWRWPVSALFNDLWKEPSAHLGNWVASPHLTSHAAAGQ